jgi:hypothetical protein
MTSGVDRIQRGCNFQANVVGDRGIAMRKLFSVGCHGIIITLLWSLVLVEGEGWRRTMMKLPSIIDLIHDDPVEEAIANSRWAGSLTAAKQE